MVDAVDVPPRKDGDTLEFECKLRERDDPEIVAVARFDAPPYSRFSSRILAAWRLNRRTERIETISPEGVSCLNPGAGAEGGLSEAALPDPTGRHGSNRRLSTPPYDHRANRLVEAGSWPHGLQRGAQPILVEGILRHVREAVESLADVPVLDDLDHLASAEIQATGRSRQGKLNWHRILLPRAS